jgi:hypothetical protein
MYFFQNTSTLHHIKDSRAYTLFRKQQFLGNFRGFSGEKILGIFSLNLEFLGDFFRAWVGNPDGESSRNRHGNKVHIAPI